MIENHREAEMVSYIGAEGRIIDAYDLHEEIRSAKLVDRGLVTREAERPMFRVTALGMKCLRTWRATNGWSKEP